MEILVNEGKDGKWYLRVVAANGEILARSSKAYPSEDDALLSLAAVVLLEPGSGPRVQPQVATAADGGFVWSILVDNVSFLYSETLQDERHAARMAKRVLELLRDPNGA